MGRTMFLAVAGVALGAWATPAVAHACGGTFCDLGPGSMPVPQTGETVLFVTGDGYSEVHVQIEYDPRTDAEAFAWIVPVPGVPTFTVGSQLLFDRLLAATVPTHGRIDAFDDCSMGDGATEGGDGVWGEKLDAGQGDEPEVVVRTTVGAFEIVVLDGGTASEVMTWLADHGYDPDPDATPILAAYLAEGALFAAFKLATAAEVPAVHPVVLRFDENVPPCVPIRLTRIASAEDLELRALFLGDARVVPGNYRHVALNPVAIDWVGLGTGYRELVSRAVDDDGADGRAFVTERAGRSDVVAWPTVPYWWKPEAFVELDAARGLARLYEWGAYRCDAELGCEFEHPLLEGLMRQYLPAPPGIDEASWWSCPGCFPDPFVDAVWDGPAFAAAFAERIVEPAEHAEQLLADHPYLTRLYTTISPGEMTIDPVFVDDDTRGDVVADRVATRRQLCDGDAVWTLPDGREVYVPAGASWPDFDGRMPAAEMITERSGPGAPVVLVDNAERIDRLLAAHNAAHGWPPTGGTGGGGGSTTDGGRVAEPGDASVGEVAGCACTADAGRLGLTWLVVLICAISRTVGRSRD